MLINVAINVQHEALPQWCHHLHSSLIVQFQCRMQYFSLRWHQYVILLILLEKFFHFVFVVSGTHVLA